MSTLGEIESALHEMEKAGTQLTQITVLHCNTEYPTPMYDVNLRAMCTIRDALGVAVGYSDHTPGIEVPVAAVALGATVIEKHLTLDRNLPGPDHKASLEPMNLLRWFAVFVILNKRWVTALNAQVLVKPRTSPSHENPWLLPNQFEQEINSQLRI